MDKDAFYFPHFSNARHDRKLKRVIKELGVEGYGIYFMLLEVLREQPGMQYPLEDIDLLADDFRTSEQKVRTVICNYRLFDVTTEECFYSPKLQQYLEPYFRMKAQRQLAGKKSGEARQRRALPEHSSNDRLTTVEQSKVKESKVKENILWKQDIEVYKQELRSTIDELLKDKNWMGQQEILNPGLNIELSIKKACINFWSTEAGWKHKKKKGGDILNWKLTMANAITMPTNKVYK